MELKILSAAEIQSIHDATMKILSEVGMVVHHDDILSLLDEAGATVDKTRHLARLDEKLIMECVAKADKKYVLYGRSPDNVARFGYDDLILMSSPGQYMWVDPTSSRRRAPTVADLRDAIKLGDALEHVDIVGAMAVPEGIPPTYRDVYLTAELVKGTTKPTRCWVANGRTARYILEIYKVLAGSEKELREKPMVEAFLEPISPLQLPRDGLEILREFVKAGQPASFGPMAMASGTAPATLAGTLAQENAEVLSGIVVTQLLQPGTPVTYGGIPHIMDQRTSICAFGSPEQGLMAVAMVQMAHFYGFPVYINVGITDSKLLDVQAGLEKGMTMIMGTLAGADTFGHAGICGTDHGASLPWLLIDNEMMAYTKRIMRGFEVNEEMLAVEVIKSVGPGGDFLSQLHTVEHFRQELWFPSPVWTRDTWEGWEAKGCQGMRERAWQQVQRILSCHEPEPIHGDKAREIDAIVDAAKRHLR